MKLDILGDWPALLAALSGIAAVLSLVRDLTAHRGRGARSAQPVIGWFLATFGVLAVVVISASLISQRLSPLTHEGRALGLIAVGGAVVAILGVAIAWRTPIPNWKSLRTIAHMVESRVSGLGGTGETGCVIPLSVMAAKAGRRRRSLARLMRHLPGKLVIIQGQAGSGKTVALRGGVAQICARASRSRRPRLLALYVDLRTLEPIDEIIDRSTVENHLKASLPEGTDLLDQYVDRPRSRPRWMFVFDLGAELSDEQTERYIEAIRSFVANRDDYAVVATRADVEVRPLFRMAPLRVHDQRELLKACGVQQVHRGALRRLRHDPQLSEIAGSPLLLSLLARRLPANDDLAESFHDILGRMILANLDTPTVAKAAKIAYGIVEDPNRLVVADQTTEQLCDLKLGWQGHNGFRFNHAVIQHYLAGVHLLSSADAVDPHELLGRPEWRPAIVAALQAGRSRLRDRFIDAIAQRVADDMSALPILVPGAGVLGNDRLLPVPGSFAWPASIRNVLRILHEGMVYDLSVERPTEVVPGVDRLVLTAVLAGAGIDREEGLRLLPLASRDIVAQLRDDVLSNRSGIKVDHRVVLPLAVRPDAYSLMKQSGQWLALLAAFQGRVVNLVLYTDVPAKLRPSALQLRVRAVIRIGRIAAVGLAAMMIAWLLRDPDPASAILACIAVGLAAAYLSSTGPPRHVHLTQLGYTYGQCLGIIVLSLSVFGGLVTALNLVTQIVTFAPGLAIISLILLWLYTWPAAMLLHVTSIHEEGGLRPFPQLELHRTTAAPIVKEFLAPILRRVLSSSARKVALILSGAMFVLAAAELPLAYQVEQAVDQALLPSVVVLTIFAFRPIREAPSESPPPLDVLRSVILPKRHSLEAALRTLVTARTDDAERRLASLDGVLEFIKETLPGEMSQPIKPRLWALMPQEQVPGFYTELKQFDKKNPGRLASMANSSKIRKAIDDQRARADTSTRTQMPHS